jgi:N-acetylglucosaminyldiphosphoundecaprenol N-acetyl-beta-D-mannosaminyltransferase
MIAQKDHDFFQAICHADLVVPDGVGIVIALKRAGYLATRIPGVDLASRIMESLASSGGRVFFFGGRPGVSRRAAERMSQRYPGLSVVGALDGYFTEQEGPDLLEQIKTASPDLLLLGLGSPRQEMWLYKYWEELNVSVGIGIGGGLDLWAGDAHRAPLWMQNNGLEWLYRLLKQPSRFRRVLALPKFLWYVWFGLRGEGESIR